MAASLRFWKCRLFRNSRQLLRCNQKVVCPVITSYVQNNNCYVTLNNKEEKNDSTSWLRKGLFVFGVAFGSYVGFRLYGCVGNTSLRRKQLLAKDMNLNSILEMPKTSNPKTKQFNFVANVVELVAPAVVHIEGHGRSRGNSFLGPMISSSSGSGFLVTEDGLVLTNAHVVKNMNNVQVTLADGSNLVGDIVDLDLVSDLAAVQLRNPNKRKFHTIKLGDSSTVRPGEFVVAMGSPLRLSNTVTSGIVSSVHRASGDLSKHLPPTIQYIQTDAAINVGNSGGPLVNLDSQLIGINTMTVQDAVGISFAIPVNTVRDFLKTFADHQSTKMSNTNRGYIGITMLTLTPEIINELGGRMKWFPNVQYGVFVPEVVFDSPSYRAGMYPGDVIVSINGVKVTNAKQIYEFVSKGELLTLEILRGPKQLRVMVQPETFL